MNRGVSSISLKRQKSAVFATYADVENEPKMVLDCVCLLCICIVKFLEKHAVCDVVHFDDTVVDNCHYHCCHNDYYDSCSDVPMIKMVLDCVCLLCIRINTYCEIS
jgi:predicted alpha/beta-fold hydrolase